MIEKTVPAVDWKKLKPSWTENEKKKSMIVTKSLLHSLLKCVMSTFLLINPCCIGIDFKPYEKSKENGA